MEKKEIKKTNLFSIRTNLVKKIKEQETLENVVSIPKKLKPFAKDISDKFQKSTKIVKCRENEIEKVWFYLSQADKNNAFLVGPHDVGKTAICLEIARQIAKKECPKEFYKKRLLQIKPEKIMEIEEELEYKDVAKELKSFLRKNKKEIVVFLDNALNLKYKEELVVILYELITKLNIPFITTCREETFKVNFLSDDNISKYINPIYVEEPEMNEIQSMMGNHIKRLKKKYEINISDEIVKFAIYTSNLSETVSANPGNIVNILKKAFLEAKRKEKLCVDKKCILSCYNSYAKLYNSMTQISKEQIAYHEIGHYIVRRYCKNITDQEIAFVSILPMLDFYGVNSSYVVLGKTVNYTKAYLIDQIAICLAGRIQEKQIGLAESTGAAQDLITANIIANTMIMVYGMSENLKNRCYCSEDGAVVLGTVSEKKKDLIEKEIQKIIDDAGKIALDIIEEKKDLVKILVKRILEEEILTGEQLEEICNEFENQNE